MGTRTVILLLSIGAFAQIASAVLGDTITYTVKGSLYDEAPEDGIVDSSSNTMWLYHSSQGDSRSIAEYDVAGFGGASLTEARVAGRLSVNNSLPSGDRIFDVLMYSGNGTMEDADFGRSATVVGTFSYDPPSVTFVDFDIDVLSAAQTLLDSGATYFGFRFQQSNEGAPNVISGSDTPVLTLVPEPSTGGLLLLAGLAAFLTRRHHRLHPCRPRFPTQPHY